MTVYLRFVTSFLASFTFCVSTVVAIGCNRGNLGRNSSTTVANAHSSSGSLDTPNPKVAHEDAKKTLEPAGLFHNDRLKQSRLDSSPITGNTSLIRIQDGMWEPESKEPERALAFPQQAHIICDNSEKTCRVLHVTILPMAEKVAIEELGEDDYHVESWNANGLFASDNPGPTDCHRSVLSVSFRSDTVSLSDIPTHNKGCEIFKETNSYRLVRGNYYVDTTLGNDSEKPTKK